jgi:hypothetical protein
VKLVSGRIGNILKEIGDTVGNTLIPIKNGLCYAIDKVAPLKWALDASGCVLKLFNKVLEEIIHLFHLDSLFDSFKHFIISNLHLDEVTSAINDVFNETNITNIVH